jgi:glycosyltransferase involved in cell wall biosynthesis
MSFAMLVFASPVPSTMEIIKHGGNGCILSGRDPDADASAILDIIGNRGTADAMRMKAFKAAARNSWDRQVNRLEAVLCRPA